MEVLMNKIYEQEKEVISYCVGCLEEDNWCVLDVQRFLLIFFYKYNVYIICI